MLLLISGFRGTAPKLDPEQLADGLSVTAENVDLSETLQGWCEPLSLGSFVPASSRYLFHYEDTYWFSWSTETTALKAPLLNDPFGTVVFTDNQYPKVTRLDIATGGAVFPNVSYRLGLPVPDVITTLVEANEVYTGSDPDDPDYDGNDLDDFTTSWKVTFVDDWGRESASSLASENVDIREYDGQMVLKVTLTLPPIPAGYPVLGDNAKYRIYRLNTSSTGDGVYQFLADVPITEGTYVDRTVSSDLQEALTTEDWLGPPDDNVTYFPNGPLRHICVVSEAFLCGHNSKMVCFSEPRVSHAWPTDYYMVFSETCVRTVNYGPDVVLLTDDHPYIISGVHPASASRMRLGQPAPCVNPEAAIEVAGSVFFAGKRGLYVIEGTSVQLVSDTFFTAKQWRNLKPEQMMFGRHHENLLIRLWDGRVLAFDPTNPTGGFTTLIIDCKSMYTDPESGGLIFSDTNGELFEFDAADTFMPVRYESKHYRFHQPMNMYAARVRANKYPVDVTIVGERRNGDQYDYTKTVEADTFFYVPTKSDTVEWFFRVNGDVDIRSIGLATSIQELNTDV